MKLVRLIFSCMILLAAYRAQGSDKVRMNYLTEDYPPSNYIENGELKGVAVDLLHAIWREMGVSESAIQVLPWARGYYLATHEPNHVLFAMTRSAEREKLFSWAGPIYRGRYSLVCLAKNPLVLRSVRDAGKYSIGVLRADYGERLLSEGGVPGEKMVPVSSVEQLVKMLFAERIDLICIYEDTLKQYAAKMKMPQNRFTVSCVLSENVMYYAFSRGSDERFIFEFRKALSAVDSERHAIVRRYNGIP